MDCSLEKECSALGGLFQSIVNDLKNTHPVWDDFAQKATKLHVQLKSTISTLNLFLDALQKIADMATAAKGATRDIGTALTRICMRHRSIENRLKTLCSALIDCLVQPLLNKMDDWHKTATQMDKDHSKEYKHCRHEIKKRTADSSRLRKKLRRGQTGVQRLLESATQEVNDRYMGLLDIERLAVRQAMIEQRAQYCLFVSWFKPVMDGEISLLNEIGQMSEVVDLLCRHSGDLYTLPQSSEAVISDAKGLENTWRFQTPPSSPGASSTSLGSRKSSFCSLNSSNLDNQSLHEVNIAGQEAIMGPGRERPDSGKLAVQQNDHVANVVRYSSMGSQDSGFISQDTLFKRPKSPKASANTTPAVLYVQPARFNSDEEEGSTTASSTPSPSPSSATWPVDQDQIGKGGGSLAPTSPNLSNVERPHTISSIYSSAVDKCSKRHPLSRITFLPPRPNAFLKKNSSYALERNFDAQYIREMSEEEGTTDDFTTSNIGLCKDSSKPLLYTPQNETNSGILYIDDKESSSHLLHKIPNFNDVGPNQMTFRSTYMNALHEPSCSSSTATSSRNMIGPVLGMRNQSGSTRSSNGRQSRRPLSFVAADNFELTPSPGDQVVAVASTPPTDDDEDTVVGDCVETIKSLTFDLDHYYNDCHTGFETDSLNQDGNNASDNVSMQSLDLYHNNMCMITPSYCTLPRSVKNGRGSGCQKMPNGGDYQVLDSCSVIGSLQSASSNVQYQNYGLNANYSATCTNTIVRRPPAQSGGMSGRPPPPPIRRNSAITSATLNAPAVDFVRSNSRCTTPVDDYVHTPPYTLATSSQQQHQNINHYLNQKSCHIFSHQESKNVLPFRQQHSPHQVPNNSNHPATYMQIRSSMKTKSSAESRNRSLPRV